jgi:hypothetical protein
MDFVRAPCTEQLFEKLGLPANLKTSEKLTPIGRELIHDLTTCRALIPHPFDHSTYPDRSLSFYVKGKHFQAWEFVKRSDEPDRVEVRFEADMDEAARGEVVKLLEFAIALLRNEPICSVPVTSNRWQAPAREPRPPSNFIPKLNKFCEDLSQFNKEILPELEELSIQSVISTVLLPIELESLEQHLAAFGWSELSPEARDLIRKVLNRTRQRRDASS